MNKIIITAAAGAVLAAGVAPMAAQAQDHKAQRAGVVSVSHGSTITVTKTSTGGKGAFGHYWTRGKDHTTGVVAEKDHSTTVNTRDGDITAINACISNGLILPSTCSSPNSEY